MKKIYISNDHTAVEMKKAMIEHLVTRGYEVIDLGNNDGQSSNYANYGLELGRAVANDSGSLGIAICGTGIGISVAANKIKGIRAGLVYEPEIAKLTKQHNNANVMATGARIISIEKSIEVLDSFLEAQFEGGRHTERVATLDKEGRN